MKKRKTIGKILCIVVTCLITETMFGGLAGTLQLARHVFDSNSTSYSIFATRIGHVGDRTANGHVIQARDHFVALPSAKVLCSNGGHEFEVCLIYKGKSVVAPIWDVGPWNTKDDYWNPPQQREMWNDLPQGIPEAQYAYQNGYNGGKDQFGRTVTNPAGIDLADGTFWDDLGMTDNDWVTVEFLWVPAVSVRDSSPYFMKGSNSGHPEYWHAYTHDGTPDGNYNGHAYIWTYVGGMSGNPSEPDCWAEFRPNLSQAGRYEVFACFYADPQNSHYVPHTVHYNGGSATVKVDQCAPGYFTWKEVKLGAWDFAPGVDTRVVVTDATGEPYDGTTTLNVDTVEFVLVSPVNNPPNQPSSLSQFRSDGITVVPEGGTTPEPTVVFKGTVSDPDGDMVRLEIELRQMSEAFTGEPTPETISSFVSSETEVTITRYGLVGGDYHWRYRAKDFDGATSNWVEFGASGNIDFTVLPNMPPNTPSNPSPPNHAPTVSINTDLSWSGGDPDAGDTVTYDVYFGIYPTPLLVSNDQLATTYDPGILSYSTIYYWKIVATDNHDASTEGPVWDFITQSPPGEWKSPTATGKNDNEWTNPTNAYTSDDQHTTAEGEYKEQDYYSFGFDLPINAIINGIEVAIEGHGEWAGGDHMIVDIFSASSNPPYGQWGTKNNGAGGWWILGDGFDQTVIGGGPTDLWGVTWQVSDFSNDNFLLRIKTFSNPDKLYVDHIQVKVYYTLTILGDLDGDGDIDHKDLLLLASAYGCECGNLCYIPEADINCDCKVDHKDLLILASNYGKET